MHGVCVPAGRCIFGESEGGPLFTWLAPWVGRWLGIEVTWVWAVPRDGGLTIPVAGGFGRNHFVKGRVKIRPTGFVTSAWSAMDCG
jgi:hypothetical protein